MLKIKDDVDLKELEKFGFEDDDERGFLEYYIGNTQVLRINKWNRLISIIQLIISQSGEKRKVAKEILNTLYDLIQAGLVEKVEE